ncbi:MULTISPECIES: YbhB/YbcL family Raf kinase inhibitor-like protein [Halomonas]|uniref:YbhB/YbcL family Raf kinase inhibitor-like protein n=1 Tax=Halomonas flagellata TaxID=2920385 RepID=A0ABS9RYJ7_9GAMM|nr:MULTISPECIES: YbhB/YbcL family Raf kinase inhibitor-like protein [Halomonas]MCH4564904.1 YbhB/YbcL family Raf kinase inhibitor-like protein [Halomonas flagellata]PXX99725.1 YbhB/YbcL family Raf kinase inhibitor-like protein [Halomonas sp. LBP4]
MAFALSTMQLESSAFKAQGAIPVKHTGEGEDVSPALAWRDAPEGTKGFAVICHDPDAPLVQNGSYGFVHWVLYNLPASTTSLEEGTTAGTSGLNDFGKSSYGGPMPPEGHGVHQYYFWVLALDKATDLPEGLSLAELLKQVEPHLLGMNRLVGTYRRG